MAPAVSSLPSSVTMDLSKSWSLHLRFTSLVSTLLRPRYSTPPLLGLLKCKKLMSWAKLMLRQVLRSRVMFSLWWMICSPVLIVRRSYPKKREKPRMIKVSLNTDLAIWMTWWCAQSTLLSSVRNPLNSTLLSTLTMINLSHITITLVRKMMNLLAIMLIDLNSD